ncbi:MAG: T9SS type A sorting domain-containing protein [Flavobacteriales bacterium]|nr:T9SS type A sorting domain-containing protein [Flavobacteriales bacterium]
MKNSVLSLLFTLACVCSNAQLVDVFHEEYASGGLGGIPAGYSTYNIYARLQDPTDRLSAVFGSTSPSPTHHLKIHSSNSADAIWNSSFAGALGSDNNCAFWGFFPDMVYDSYVTIGATSGGADPCPDCAGTQGTIFQITNPAGQISATFAPGGGGLAPDLTIADGSWFIPNDGSCNGFGQAPDNRVLIAQVTVPTGTLEYWLNISLFDEAQGANQLVYVHTQQDEPGEIGFIQETDGNCLGLVYPSPEECGVLCNDATACNYNPDALLDLDCVYPGCTNSAACNYDPQAGCDDGTCVTEGCGCLDPEACNYVADAIYNVNCVYPGCTNPDACNYNLLAGCDDGTCHYKISGHVYMDADTDQTWDGFGFDEPGMFNQPVTLQPIGMTVFTDSNGYYEFILTETGTYTVEVNPDDPWAASGPSSFVLEIPGCHTEDFGLLASDNTEFWLSGPCCVWNMNIHCTNGFNPGLWIHNTGPVSLNGTVTITNDELLTVVPLSGAVSPTTIEPGTTTWEIESHLPGQSLLYQCHINGPGADYIGEVFPITIILTLWDDEETTFYENTWTLYPTVVCSYDPNDKYAEPMGYTEDNHFILPQTDIEYRIRFQNTGNYVAEDITIVDTLDTDVLDLDSFQPLFASDNFMTCLHPDGVVEFIFNDIMLPDSTTDEPGSQGFVVFRISPQPDLVPGTVINNSAGIIFDGNDPVITNTMWHTIYGCDGAAAFSSTGTEACFGQEVSFTQTENYMESVQWFEGEILVGSDGELSSATWNEGEHEFTLMTSNPLCEEESTINLIIHPNPVVDAGADATLCEGESVLLNASGEGEIQWSNGVDNNSDYSPAESELLVATATNEFGCTGSDDLQLVVNPLPGTDISQAESTLIAPDGDTWQWYDSNGEIVGATNQEFEPAADGYYYCVVTNEFGCTSTTVEFMFVGLTEFQNTGFAVYPNPASGVCYLVAGPDFTGGTMRVYESTGQLVMERLSLLPGINTIDVSVFANGTYTVELINNAIATKQRLIVR